MPDTSKYSRRMKLLVFGALLQITGISLAAYWYGPRVILIAFLYGWGRNIENDVKDGK